MISNMKHNIVFLLAGVLILITECDRGSDSNTLAPDSVVRNNIPANTPSQSDEQVLVTVLEFNEVETGLDPYITRMIISDRYIRIDDGAESDGYVLFDRLKKRIFSVVNDNESILVVDPIIPLQAVPSSLEIRAERVDTTEAPMIGDVKPDYYQFHANDTLCYHLVTAKGFLPEVTKALQSYQTVLAAQQQETIESTPKELRTPCFLANYIYAPIIYISKGFPIEVWDVSGYHRSLIGVEEEASVSKTIFQLPDGYEYFSIGSGNIKI